jgi:uncharacterized damage-inducible protein DinB
MPNTKLGRPAQAEASTENWSYINRVAGADPVGALRAQRQEALKLFSQISEEKSRQGYAPGKWSIRTILNHISDCERTFAYRALWFSRGFDDRLPSIEQEIAASHAGADAVLWALHVEEFDRVRLSTISLFENMPLAQCQRQGIASDKPISVRALAFLIAGHTAHHLAVLRDRYL